MNIYDFLQIPALMFPHQEILVDGERRLSYGALLERVNRLAIGLRGAGFVPGEPAAVLDVNSHRYVEAYLAIAALGGTFVPLNYRAKGEELPYLLENARATTIFYGSRYRDLLPAAESGLATRRIVLDTTEPEVAGELRYEALLAATASSELEPQVVDEEDIAVLMYTSGTTSRPKGVNLSHGDFTLYITNAVELADGSDRGTALMVMPLYHIAGATNVLTSLFSGRRLVLQPQFEVAAWLRTIPQERVTHSFLVPTMLKRVLDHDSFPQTDLGSLHNLAVGGAPMPVPVIRQAIEQFPATVGFVNAFGQTETTSTLTVLGPEDHRLTGTAAEIEARVQRLASVGRPLPDVEIQIVGADEAPLATGEVGEIWVRTDRLMKGYTGQGPPTLQGQGWHATGDLGWLDEGGYLFIAGRKDDMIIRGGENLSPAEMESVLHAHPDVEDVAVFGVPDLEWGQRVAAAIVLRPQATADAKTLREFVHERLASFKKPDVVRFFKALPKTATGKTIKRELTPLFTEPPSDEPTATAPQPPHPQPRRP